MYIQLTATADFDGWLAENESIIGFEINKDTLPQIVEIELNHVDFYRLICNLSKYELIISAANESGCNIEIYNDYREY